MNAPLVEEIKEEMMFNANPDSLLKSKDPKHRMSLKRVLARRKRWSIVTTEPACHRYKSSLCRGIQNTSYDEKYIARYTRGITLTPIMRACLAVDIEQFYRAIQEEPLTYENVNMRVWNALHISNRLTPLQILCKAAHRNSRTSKTPWDWRNIATYLLDAGANPNCDMVLPVGLYPSLAHYSLAQAVTSKNPELCYLLTSRGANFDGARDHPLSLFTFNEAAKKLTNMVDVFEIVARRVGFPKPDRHKDNIRIYETLHPEYLFARHNLTRKLGEFRADTVVVYAAFCYRLIEAAFEKNSPKGEYESALVWTVLQYLVNPCYESFALMR